MYNLYLIHTYVFGVVMLIPIFFKKSQVSQDIEFFSPDFPEILFIAPSLESGFDQAQTRLAHQLLKDPTRPKPIQYYLENEKFKDEKFFIVNLESVYFDDAIEKVTITSPKSLLKRIEDAISKNPMLKSRSAFLAKGAEELLKKEESSNLLKDTVITSLSNLTKESPAYYVVKFAYIHDFIENSRDKSKNYVDLLVHNLRQNDVRRAHPYEFPLQGDRIYLKDECELDVFIDLFNQEYAHKGFSLEKQKTLENGKFNYWLFRISWDVKNTNKFLDTTLNSEDFVWCSDFVQAYLESKGIVVESKF